ncbi:MAG: hypothetical protein ACT4OP_01300 [Actinomycetota bacterium]
MDGIEIPREVAESAGMPADLDASQAGEYTFPDPRRRKIAAVIYLVVAGLAVLVVPAGAARWYLVAASVVLSAWHWLGSWPLNLEADQALARAAASAPFAIGHASAAVIFSGWRSRPLWHVVVYDSSEPPERRALIVVDGVTGERRGVPYVEDLSQMAG